MKYSVKLDNNGYIESIEKNDKGKVEIDFSVISVDDLSCYKVVDNVLVLDEEKIIEKHNQLIKEREISDLKYFLEQTSDISNDFTEQLLSLDNPLTFISDFVGLIKSYKETYKTILNQRKEARQRIKELEKTST